MSADTSAILLAAGQGTRIEGTTAEPKVLLDLHGQNLLERHFKAWEAVGLQHAVLVVGYEQQLIREAVAGLDTPLELTWIDNQKSATKGNSHSMWLGLKASPAEAIVFDADLVYEPAILKRFVDAPEPNGILVGSGCLDDIECAKALVDERGCVRNTIDKRVITEMELQELREEVQRIKLQQLDESKYTEWGPEEIAAWIINLDPGRMMKYENAVKSALKEEEADGDFLERYESLMRFLNP